MIGAVSADLGTEDESVVRRTGRHLPPVSCPRMMKVRSKFFHAVDIHDQLCVSKFRFVFVCKKRAWSKLEFGLKEICVVNMFVIK